MISGYLARGTPLHCVPAGAKLTALALLSLALLPVDDWRLLAAGLCLVLAVYAALGREALRRIALLRPFLILFAIIAAFQLLTATWQDAAASILRLVLMILLADLVTMTTRMQDMMAALMPVLKLLGFSAASRKKLSLMVSLAVRFVPLLAENWNARDEAWRARSGRRAPLRQVAPFLAETLRTSDHIAEALDARGFAANRGRRSK